MISIFLAAFFASIAPAKTLTCAHVAVNGISYANARVYLDPEFGFAHLSFENEVIPLSDADSLYSPFSSLRFDRNNDCLGSLRQTRTNRLLGFQCRPYSATRAEFQVQFDSRSRAGKFESNVQTSDGWYDRQVIRFRCR